MGGKIGEGFVFLPVEAHGADGAFAACARQAEVAPFAARHGQQGNVVGIVPVPFPEQPGQCFLQLLHKAAKIRPAGGRFNGLRIILLEFRQNELWEKSVNIFVIIAMIGIIAFGTRTIIIANGLSLG